ncbi:MAG TPA: hypothetical protein DCO77_03565 [Nitrospiraceae bacterium]|nr:hypothetical protein [Nitrospiraceae bacterium]
MKKKERIREVACSQFCPYYKPDRNEELACRGFVVVQQLIDGDTSIALEGPAQPAMHPGDMTGALRDRLCSGCPFYDGDCDFILTGGSAPPCGGFTLLLHLLGAGSITINDVTKLTDQEQQKER